MLNWVKWSGTNCHHSTTITHILFFSLLRMLSQDLSNLCNFWLSNLNHDPSLYWSLLTQPSASLLGAYAASRLRQVWLVDFWTPCTPWEHHWITGNVGIKLAHCEGITDKIMHKNGSKNRKNMRWDNKGVRISCAFTVSIYASTRVAKS